MQRIDSTGAKGWPGTRKHKARAPMISFLFRSAMKKAGSGHLALFDNAAAGADNHFGQGVLRKRLLSQQYPFGISFGAGRQQFAVNAPFKRLLVF